jgi:hypothetical protein
MPGDEGAGSFLGSGIARRGGKAKGIGAGDRDRTGDIQLGNVVIN